MQLGPGQRRGIMKYDHEAVQYGPIRTGRTAYQPLARAVRLWNVGKKSMSYSQGCYTQGSRGLGARNTERARLSLVHYPCSSVISELTVPLGDGPPARSPYKVALAGF